MYSKDLSQKIFSAKGLQMKQGKHVGRTCIFGYKKDKTDYTKMVIDEPAAKIIKLIFALAIEGNKAGRIAIILNNQKILPPYSYRKEHLKTEIVYCSKATKTNIWLSEQISLYLKDERYTGTYIGRKEKRINMYSKKKEKLPENEWICIENFHEAIVSKEDFKKAQAIFSKRKTKIMKPNRRETKALFATVLKCELCGRTLIRNDTKKPYYRCISKKTMPSCACSGILLDEENLKTAVFQSIKIQIALITEQQTAKTVKLRFANLKKLAISLENELTRVKSEQMMAFEKFADSKLTLEEFKHTKAGYDKKACELQDDLKKLHTEQQAIEECDDNSLSLGKYHIASTLTRDMLIELVKEIKVYEDSSIEIVWNFQK